MSTVSILKRNSDHGHDVYLDGRRVHSCMFGPDRGLLAALGHTVELVEHHEYLKYNEPAPESLDELKKLIAERREKRRVERIAELKAELAKLEEGTVTP